MSEDANVIKHAGHTLYRNTVVGVVDETGDLITVASLTSNLGERMLQLNVDKANLVERVAELSDAMQVLIDEVLELRDGKPNRKALELALENAVSVRAGKACKKG